MRIGSDINAEHPRKGTFLKQISRSIFVESPEDRQRLLAAQSQLSYELTPQQRKRDLRHVRRMIPDGHTACQKVLMVVNCTVAQDKEAMKAHLASSAVSSTEDNTLTVAHLAKPTDSTQSWETN